MVKYLTTGEVAAWLRRSPWYVRDLVREGVLKAHRLKEGGRMLFDPVEVVEALGVVGEPEPPGGAVFAPAPAAGAQPSAVNVPAWMSYRRPAGALA